MVLFFLKGLKATIVLYTFFLLTACSTQEADSKALTDEEIQEILSTVVGGDEVLLDAGERYFANLSTENNNMMTAPELYDLVQTKSQEIYILDIRQNEDFQKGHIEGANNQFWFDVGRILEDLPKDKHIIVYCYSGQSAGQVVGVLNTIGFKASAMTGGWNGGWLANNLPVSN